MRISETGKPLPLRKTASPSPANVRKNPAYLHRPCQNPEAPARHPLIDMRAELYAFARQGVRIASGVDSRIEIGMHFIRRYVQQGDYPIFRSFPHESQQAILGIVADFDEGAAPLPGSESRSIVPQSDQPPVELRRFARIWKQMLPILSMKSVFRHISRGISI